MKTNLRLLLVALTLLPLPAQTPALFGWNGRSLFIPDPPHLIRELTGDRLPDLVHWDAVYRNHGDFEFRPHSTLPGLSALPGWRSGEPPRFLTGDLNGNSFLDLVVLADSQLFIFLNDGTGRFTDATSIWLTTPLPSIADGVLFDLDGDRTLDLVLLPRPTSPQGQGPLLAFLNSGAPPLVRDSTRFPAIPYLPLIAMDVDGDGDVDLVGSPYGSLGPGDPPVACLLLNDGRGFFSDVSDKLPTALRRGSSTLNSVCDLDGDGLPEIIIERVEPHYGGYFPPWPILLKNHGGGAFAEATAQFSGLPRVFGDVTGNGSLDFFSSIRLSFPPFLNLNDGKGNFTSVLLPRSFHKLKHLADLDGSGLAEGIGGKFLARNIGGGRFEELCGAGERLPDQEVALGDVDGDGWPDLVFGNQLSTPPFSLGEPVTLYLQRNGAFEESSGVLPVVPQADSYRPYLVDLDHDGLPELLLLGTKGLCYYRNHQGRYTEDHDPGLTGTPVAGPVLVFGDVDGNKSVDIVVADREGPVRLFLNDGRGRFTCVTATHMPGPAGPTESLILKDFDGDGYPDLFVGTAKVARHGGHQDRYYRNDRSGRFVDATAFALPAQATVTRHAVSADLTGNGQLDLLLSGVDPEGHVLLEGDGTGRFRPVAFSLPLPAASGGKVGVADLDEDGILDLVVGYGANTSVLLGQGQGRFVDSTPEITAALGLETLAIYEVADLDQDGDFDLLLAEVHGYAVNLTRQIQLDGLTRVGGGLDLFFYARAWRGDRYHLVLPFIASRPGRTPLGPLGTFGLDPQEAIALPLALVDPLQGMRAMHLPVPAEPALLGVDCWVQALVLSDLAYPIGAWRLTNTLQESIR